MKSLLVVTVLAALSQSLGDVARREAERRKNIEPGAEGERVLTNADVAKLGTGGNVSVFSPAMKKPPPTAEAPRGSPMRFRSALMKLDREIRTLQDRLDALKAKAAAERWAVVGSGRSRSGRSERSNSKQRDAEIAELSRKLERLKHDRLGTYDAGRRAGFLPGELEGKGIVP